MQSVQAGEPEGADRMPVARPGESTGSGGAEIRARVVAVEPDVISILMPTASVPRRDRGCRGEPAHGRRLGRSGAIRTSRPRRIRSGARASLGRSRFATAVRHSGWPLRRIRRPSWWCRPCRDPQARSRSASRRGRRRRATIPTLADDGPRDPPRLSVPALPPLPSPSTTCLPMSGLSHDGP